MNNLTKANKKSWTDLIWEKLHCYQEDCISTSMHRDEEWDEICTAMAWIQEELGCEEEMDDSADPLYQVNLMPSGEGMGACSPIEKGDG